MFLTKELIEIYSENLGLLFLLVDSQNEIIYEVNPTPSSSFDLKIENLAEITNISLSIKNPTIVSKYIDLLNNEVFFIVTPYFQREQVDLCLIIGPFIIQNQKKDNDYSYLTVTDEQVEEMLDKIRKLYKILSDKTYENTNIARMELISNIFHSFSETKFELLISHSLKDLLKIEEIDFVGVALKDENDVFIVEHVFGNHILQLQKKKFYLGEGILGKAAILGTVINWSKNIDANRAEFFHRYGVIPTNLFALPIKKANEVQLMIFGGNFSQKSLSKQLLTILSQMITLNYQKNNAKDIFKEIDLIQTMFVNWLDLLEIILNSNEKKYILFKILDFMQVLNHNNFTCFTNIHNGDFLYRGTLSSLAIQQHYNILEDTASDFGNSVIIRGNVAHFYFLDGHSRFGLCTVVFEQIIETEQLEFLFQLLAKSLTIKFKNTREDKYNIYYICELLHSSLEEIDKETYQKTVISLKLVNKLMDILQVPTEKQHLLRTLTKVLPYSFSYLTKQLVEVEEWEYIRILYDCLETRKISVNVNLEVQILIFVYEVFYSERAENEWIFSTNQLKDIFLNALEVLNLRVQTFPSIEESMEEDHSIQYIIESLLLTAREKEILMLVLDGLNNQEISVYLKISVHTVKNHVTNILKKLNVSDRVQLIGKIYRLKDGEDF